MDFPRSVLCVAAINSVVVVVGSGGGVAAVTQRRSTAFDAAVGRLTLPTPAVSTS